MLILHKNGKLRILFLILSVVLIQGVLRATLIPPWQNFDEPGHMEYVLYIVENRQIPAETDIDYSLRQRISDTYQGMECSNDVPGAILGCLSFHQFQEPPLYYLIQAGVQLLFKPTSITGALLLARIVSMVLFTMMLMLVYLSLWHVRSENPQFAIITTSMLAFLPGLVNTMSSVNNDVMAIVAGTLLSLAMMELINADGFSFKWLIVVLVASVLAIFSKPTATLLIPVALLGVWLALPFNRPIWYALPVLVGLLVVPLVFDISGAGKWTKMGGDITDRVRMAEAPLGDYVFSLPAGQRSRQLLSASTQADVAGNPVTVSAWVQGHGILQIDQGDGILESLSFNTNEWTHISQSVPIAEDVDYVAVVLEGGIDGASFDAVSMIPGNYVMSNQPQWHTVQARRGTWGDTEVINLLRNGSAERFWMLLTPSINERLPFGINWRLQAMYSWWVTGSTYSNAITAIFLSFWGSFAWGATMFSMPFTGLLALISLGSAVGITLMLWRDRREITSWHRVVLIMVLISGLALFTTLLRIDPPPGTFIPSARYLYPAVMPVVGLFVVGWRDWLPRKATYWIMAGFILTLYLAQIISLFTIQAAYFGGLGW